MKKIFLNERQYRIIVESLLLEMSVDDIYTKYYSNVPRQDFERIVKADPTSKPNKMGKYSKWLLSLYMHGTLKVGDLTEAKECLECFNKYINRIEVKDINHYKSVRELYDVVAPFMQDPTQATSKTDALRKQKHEEAVKVYEDDTWMVIVPLTQKASCIYGKGTKWCTAAESSQNMFDYYNNRGRLYININKATGEKYQFHFESGSFMDENDDELDYPIPQCIDMSQGLMEFYKNKVGKQAFLGLVYPYVTSMNDEMDIWGAELDDERWAYVDSDGNRLFGDDADFNNIWPFKDGIAKVGVYMTESEAKGEDCESYGDYMVDDYYRGESVHEYYNFINENGEYLSKKWFFDASNFYDNFAYVKLKGVKGSNLIRRDGTYLFPWGKYKISDRTDYHMWKLYDFRTKMYNAVNDNGELVSPNMWFVDMHPSLNRERPCFVCYAIEDGRYKRCLVFADGKIIDSNK